VKNRDRFSILLILRRQKTLAPQNDEDAGRQVMDLEKNWLREFARDFIAFGSIPFLIITVARVSVIQIYYPMQFIISSAIFFVLKALFKGDMHAGLGFILLTFTSIFYMGILRTLILSLGSWQP